MPAEWIAAATTLVSALVAACAAIFALSQAISARRQADSSERSADIADGAARSAEKQAKEARRANDLNERLTRGRAIAAIDDYARALATMTQEIEHWLRVGSAHENSARRHMLAEAARTKRDSIIAALNSEELQEKWRQTDAEFDAIDMYLIALAEGGAPKDASALTLSKGKPAPESHIEGMVRINEIWVALFDLRDAIDT